jgi:DNA-binding NtrC family response regulator
MISTCRKASILVVDDVPDYIATLRDPLQLAGWDVHGATSSEEALRLVETVFVDLLLIDQRLGRTRGTTLFQEIRKRCPGMGGILFSGSVDLECALAAIRVGALDVIEKPIKDADLVAAVSQALSDSELVRGARYSRWQTERSELFPGIIGESEVLQRVLAEVRSVAPTTAPILIQGESGTGKELVARAIHASGPRRNGPFIAVNAGALPPTLLETTLFGSKKGAYTDSRADQPGLFEAAQGGTLFLDEIGETTVDFQVRLLRAVQEKIVTRVGDVEPTPVDVRIITATNRDLRKEVNENRFRSDLYFRLAVVTITMPRLCDRGSDIALLANHFLHKHAHDLGKTVNGFAPGCLEKLKAYRWPGNVRELDNVMQRAAILCEGTLIMPHLLMLEGPIDAGSPSGGVSLNGTYEEAKESMRKSYFERLYFERAGRNKVKAAEIAGIDRSVLYDHLNKLGIS